MRSEGKSRKTLLTVLIAAMLVTRGVAEPFTVLAIAGKLALVALKAAAVKAAVVLAHSHLAILYAKYNAVKKTVTNVIEKGDKLIKLEKETRDFVKSLHTQCFDFYTVNAHAQVFRTLFSEDKKGFAAYVKEFKFLKTINGSMYYTQKFSKVHVLAAQINDKILTIESEVIDKTSENLIKDAENDLAKIQDSETKAKGAIKNAENAVGGWEAPKEFITSLKHNFDTLINKKNEIIAEIQTNIHGLQNDAEKEQMQLLEAGLQKYLDKQKGDLSIDCVFTALYRLAQEGHVEIYILENDEALTKSVENVEEKTLESTLSYNVADQSNASSKWFPNSKFDPAVFKNELNKLNIGAIKLDPSIIFQGVVSKESFNGTLMAHFYSYVFGFASGSVKSEGLI